MRTVPLGGSKAKGRVARVDDEDYEVVSQFKWYVKEDRRANGYVAGPYAATSVHENGTCRTVRMHTLLTGWREVDHKDHDGLNNQRSNLRDATRQQNSHNARPWLGNAASRFKGVSWDSQAGKWKALIRVRGKYHYLGFYADEEQAARAYDAAAQDLFGEFAYVNLPQECIVQATAATTVGLVAGTPTAE